MHSVGVVTFVHGAVHGIDRHHFFGRHDEGAHHALVLVLEDVAVVHVAAGAAGEPGGDRHQFTAIRPANPDGVLPAVVGGFERSGLGVGHRAAPAAHVVAAALDVDVLPAQPDS